MGRALGGWAPLLAPLALALLVAGACGGDGATPGPETVQQVQGQIVDVTGRSIGEVETLVIRDAAGRLWTFTTQGFIEGFTPSHLREHQLFGQAVQVAFVERDGRLVAVAITD